MNFLDTNKYICEYSYEGDEGEIFTIEGYTLKYVKRKLTELLDAECNIIYKIYSVIEEGIEYFE